VNERERVDVPWVVVKSVGFLDNEANLALDGLFRTVPSMADVQRLQRVFEESTDQEAIDLTAVGADAHAVGGLLKRFFRELPEPIFTDALYEKWTNSQCSYRIVFVCIHSRPSILVWSPSLSLAILITAVHTYTHTYSVAVQG
jgi:breakpoint cluster region protein